MATRSSSVSSTVVPTTAAERIAAYRAAAKTLAPRASTVETSAAEAVGKLGSDFVSFFGDVRAVYKVERSLRS